MPSKLRLNVIPIKLPALRERTEDIPQLAEFFLRRYNARFRKKIQGVTDSTMAMLKKYWWPGNIRELENLIERLVAVSDKDYIAEEDLPLLELKQMTVILRNLRAAEVAALHGPRRRRRLAR